MVSREYFGHPIVTQVAQVFAAPALRMRQCKRGTSSRCLLVAHLLLAVWFCTELTRTTQSHGDRKLRTGRSVGAT
jgi:hypothetical protein